MPGPVPLGCGSSMPRVKGGGKSTSIPQGRKSRDEYATEDALCLGCRGRCTRAVAAVRPGPMVVRMAPMSYMNPDHPGYANDDPTEYSSFRCIVCHRWDDAHDETEWL